LLKSMIMSARWATAKRTFFTVSGRGSMLPSCEICVIDMPFDRKKL